MPILSTFKEKKSHSQTDVDSLFWSKIPKNVMKLYLVNLGDDAEHPKVQV